MHFPPRLAKGIVAKQSGWLKRITCRPYRARSIKSERIGGTLRTAEASPEHYRENLAKVVDYMLKGAMPEVAAVLNIRRRDGGRILGKRMACYQHRNSRGG